ncbi:sensor histidine kinase [Nocardia sp. NPDC056064]|uniref:sensor histidine kinase n=1 Tax=Nocardia sp. NPDC056064 TaxID=3345701 RepID=UPI0035E1C748
MRGNLSLRTRVAVAAATGTTLIVGALAVFLFVAIERNNIRHVDEQLDIITGLVEANVGTAQLFIGSVRDGGFAAITLHQDGAVLASTSTRLPELPEGHQTLVLDDAGYRVKTMMVDQSPIGPHLVSVAAPLSAAESVTREQRRHVLLAGAAAIAVASGLGWLLGGRAIRPLIDLTRRIDAGDELPEARGRFRVREADRLAASVRSMLARIDSAQQRTISALETARTFANTAAHELRTPLTAIRMDIEIARDVELVPAERAQILDDALRKHGRVESTLVALELLAAGELTSRHISEPADLVELAYSAVADAARTHPELHLVVAGEQRADCQCSPAGIRLILDNAITNAVRHGRATRIEISVHRTGDGFLLAVDDNGTGLPENERDVVFGRFRRGSGAAREGSGLGLALVAQQAELHGGRAELITSPLGGLRLAVTLACAPTG